MRGPLLPAPSLAQACRDAKAPKHIEWTASALVAAVFGRCEFHRVYGPVRGADEWRSARLPDANKVAQSCRALLYAVDADKRAVLLFLLETAVQDGMHRSDKLRTNWLNMR